MNALVLANFPLAILVILAIVGIPLWMTFKRPESAPDFAEARAYLGAQARPVRTGLTPVRQHALAHIPAARTSAAHGRTGRTAQRTRAAA